MNAFIDKNGVLTSWGYMESNNDDILVDVPDDFNSTPGTVQYKDDAWAAYAVPVDYVTPNAAQQVALMTTANATTFGMADAYVAGLLDDVDTAKFKAWAAYKLALSKVDLTVAAPVWPTVPAST